MFVSEATLVPYQNIKVADPLGGTWSMSHYQGMNRRSLTLKINTLSLGSQYRDFEDTCVPNKIVKLQMMILFKSLFLVSTGTIDPTRVLTLRSTRFWGPAVSKCWRKWTGWALDLLPQAPMQMVFLIAALCARTWSCQRNSPWLVPGSTCQASQLHANPPNLGCQTQNTRLPSRY